MNARKAIGLCFFCAGLVFASWASRIPDIKQALGLTDGQLGSLLMGLPAGQLLTLPLSAYLESRFGSKNLARPGLLLYALMLVLTSQAPTPLTLALALFGMGSLGNITSISINTQGVLAEKQEGRTIMSTFHGLWSLAGFTGALLGLTMMWFHVSPARHFLFVWLLVFVLVQILHPHLIASGERKQKAKARFDKTLLPLGMIGFCSFATEGSMFDWSGVYFREVVHAPSHFILLGYSAFMICMASGRLLGDRVIRRWGRLPVLGASGILMSTGLCLAILFPQLVPATLAFMMVGFGVSSVVPNVYSLAGSSPSVEPGVAIATVASMAYFGFLLGPPMIGYVSSVSSLRVSYGVIAILGLLIFQLRKNIQRA
ncbi:MAG: MFS transporter [Candidatus Eremiobacteraeota bacterium]|nr:MFS transporter [Candidatus Eremiobacteraeota bacterium]